MSYYVYDGSGLSAVCLSVLSFCRHDLEAWRQKDSTVLKYQHNKVNIF